MADDIGLQLLYSPKQGSPVADLVFVHGLGGHRRKTWTRKRPSAPSDNLGFLGRLVPGRKRKAVAIDDESMAEASTQSESGSSDVFWPQDLLPKDLPDCRIFTWGYNVNLNLARTDTSTATVFSHAKTLLSDVADARMSAEEKVRPLIFVAHSLGGIVVKDALNISYKERSYLRDILPATLGICFLGTPHRGSSKAALAETLSRVTETWGNAPNMQILQALKYDAETLDRVQSDFLVIHSEHLMKIRTFQEGLDYKGFIIVDRFSSRMDIQGEMPVDIEANHVEMVKFRSAKDNGYIRVSKTLLRWVGELKEQQAHDSALLLDIMEDCLQSLDNSQRGSRSQQVDPPFRGTLDWLFSDKISFSSWLQDPRPTANPLYWISGKPGSGKSTIMKYALKHERTKRLLQSLSPGTWSILSFFFHDRGSDIQKNIHGLMEELVFQLLSTHRKLIPLVCHIRISSLIENSGKPRQPGAGEFSQIPKLWTKDDMEEAKRVIDRALPEELHAPWSLTQLEMAFKIILYQSDVPFKACLFIDALDEHSGDHQRLLTMIQSLEQKETTDTISIKICVSSRPEPSFEVAFASCPQFKVQHQTKRDITLYAQGYLEANADASTAELDRAQLQLLATEVTEKAEGVFIWVRLVVKELVEEFVNGSSFFQLRQLLSALPKELEDLYLRILGKRKPVYKNEFDLMCHLMLTSSAPLSLESLILIVEVNLTGQWSNWSVESMVRRLSSRSGGLIEVVGVYSKIRGSDPVQFIHKTFRDFIRLPEKTSNTGDSPPAHIHENACMALLRASTYVLKYLNTDTRSAHDYITNGTFHYAAQLEHYSQTSKSTMIEVLELLLDRRGSDVSEPGIPGLLLWIEKYAKWELSWIKRASNSEQVSLRGLDYIIATLSVNYGGIHYVGHKVNGGLPLEYPKRCSLLWSLVNGFIEYKGTSGYTNPALQWPVNDYKKLLSHLVSRGAEVGKRWAGLDDTKVDELQLLLKKFESLSKGERIDEALKLMECLLQYGADPNKDLRINFVKGYSRGHSLWFLEDRNNWHEQLWKLLLKYGADPMLKAGHDHHLLYHVIISGQSKVAKLLCKAGADPSKLGQGINALKPDQCTVAQFNYHERDMRLFLKNAIQMQSMLQRYHRDRVTPGVDSEREMLKLDDKEEAPGDSQQNQDKSEGQRLQTLQIGVEAEESDEEESSEESDNDEDYGGPSKTSTKSEPLFDER